MTITEFLLARIDEDEAAAKAATPGPWFTVAPHGYDDAPATFGRLVSANADWNEFGNYVTPAGGEHGDDGLAPADAEHIARHDPARVLAECEAKRALVALHYELDGGAPETFPYVADDGRTIWPGCAVCDEGSPRRPHCDTIRTLAAIYADHTDYDKAWRPA